MGSIIPVHGHATTGYQLIMEWRIAILFTLFIWVGNVNGKFAVVRYWNGVASEDETAVIAVKVNGKIEECIWTKQDDRGDGYSSEDRNNGDVEVSIGEQDTLCKLKVKKANRDDHDGLWDVLLIGKCNDKGNRRRGRQGRGKKRRKRQIVTIPNTPKISGAVNIGVLKRRGKPTNLRTNRRQGIANRKSSSRLASSDCDNEAEYFDMEMLITKSGRNSEISMLAGSFEVSGIDNEKVVLSGRTSKKADTCLLREDDSDGDKIL